MPFLLVYILVAIWAAAHACVASKRKFTIQAGMWIVAFTGFWMLGLVSIFRSDMLQVFKGILLVILLLVAQTGPILLAGRYITRPADRWIILAWLIFPFACFVCLVLP